MEMEHGETQRPRGQRRVHLVPPREEVIRRIEALASTFVECIAAGKCMDLETLRRASDAMDYDEEKQQLVHNHDARLIRFGRGGARKYTSAWLILQTVHELLLERKTVTQRELYYLHPFFKQQNEADEAIIGAYMTKQRDYNVKRYHKQGIDVGCLLRVPRSCLNIFGATKGCFSGCLKIKRDEEWGTFDDGDEHPISQQLLQIEPSDLETDARCIIVIEKDGIFNRLREDKFTERVPSILVTGRGYPDLATRMFVSMLSLEFNIPVYGLSDCNPFGLSIMLTYRIGSARMPLDTQPYTINLRWIGLRPSSIESLRLPPTAFKPLTPKDRAAADSLLKSRFVQTQASYKDELRCWTCQRLPFKIELEALHLLGFGFLSKFVEECINQHLFI